MFENNLYQNLDSYTAAAVLPTQFHGGEKVHIQLICSGSSIIYSRCGWSVEHLLYVASETYRPYDYIEFSTVLCDLAPIRFSLVRCDLIQQQHDSIRSNVIHLTWLSINTIRFDPVWLNRSRVLLGLIQCNSVQHQHELIWSKVIQFKYQFDSIQLHMM